MQPRNARIAVQKIHLTQNIANSAERNSMIRGIRKRDKYGKTRQRPKRTEKRSRACIWIHAVKSIGKSPGRIPS